MVEFGKGIFSGSEFGTKASIPAGFPEFRTPDGTIRKVNSPNAIKKNYVPLNPAAQRIYDKKYSSTKVAQTEMVPVEELPVMAHTEPIYNTETRPWYKKPITWIGTGLVAIAFFLKR